MTKRPLPAYKGDAPYVFVCYAHADAAVVYPEIDWLRNQGFNIWYDEGISAGADWRDEIAGYIDRAEAFLLYLSPASVRSGDCVRELNYAVDQNKAMVITEVEPTELRGGVKLAIAPIQSIRRHELAEETYRNRLHDGLRRHVKHSIRTLADQTVAFSDLTGFGAFSRMAPNEAVEGLLVQYENVAVGVCHRWDGVVRSIDGDSCLMTFADPNAGVAAASEFANQWLDYVEARRLDTQLAIGVAFGGFRVFRSFSFGGSLSVASALSTLARSLPETKTRVLLSDRVEARIDDRWIRREIDPGLYFRAADAQSRGNALLYENFLTRSRTFELDLRR